MQARPGRRFLFSAPASAAASAFAGVLSAAATGPALALRVAARIAALALAVLGAKNLVDLAPARAPGRALAVVGVVKARVTAVVRAHARLVIARVVAALGEGAVGREGDEGERRMITADRNT